MKMFSRLTCNLLPSGCRLDTLEGREFTVVPMIILTEGVHQGSNGPLYYPKDELSKTPVVWNHKPIVVYHPTMNGEGISACDPVIINSRKVGIMMNTKFEGGRLKSEAWLEKERANKVDERIMTAVDAKEMMELSTGVFIDVEDTSGKWKGEEYQGIARNYRPDHLALLPDQIGACSVADGAGFCRNQKKGGTVRGTLHHLLEKIGLVENELSFSDIGQELMTEINEKLNPSGSDAYRCWVIDIYSNFVVFSMNDSLWRIGYTSDDTGVTLTDEAPVEVFRVTEYRTEPANNTATKKGNLTTPTSNQKEDTMNKKQHVDAIIAANSGFKEEDREALMELTDKQLESLANLHKEMPAVNISMERKDKDGKVTFNLTKKEEPKPAPAAPTTPTAAAAAPTTPVATAVPVANVVTVQDYIKQAPKEVQEVLNNSLSIYQEEKSRLVTMVLASEGNEFKKEDLEARPLSELRMIAKLAAPKVETNRRFDFSGQAPVPTGNTQEEALALPALTFTKN